MNSTDDDPDLNPGDGNCWAGQTTPLQTGGLVGECTLRAALQESNARYAAFPLTVDFYLATGNDGQPDVFFGSATCESGDATLWDPAVLLAPAGFPEAGLGGGPDAFGLGPERRPRGVPGDSATEPDLAARSIRRRA